MKSKLSLTALACALSLMTAPLAEAADPGPGGGHVGGPPGGHFADGRGAWAPHDGWHGDMHHFDHGRWQGGHWWHGTYAGRVGWWWIVGPDWYWYPAAIYPYPNPYIPPDQAAGFWYWCDAYQQYYPYVGACPSGWRAVPPQ
jgi:hypothetical protein